MSNDTVVLYKVVSKNDIYLSDENHKILWFIDFDKAWNNAKQNGSEWRVEAVKFKADKDD